MSSSWEWKHQAGTPMMEPEKLTSSWSWNNLFAKIQKSEHKEPQNIQPPTYQLLSHGTKYQVTDREMSQMNKTNNEEQI